MSTDEPIVWLIAASLAVLPTSLRARPSACVARCSAGQWLGEQCDWLRALWPAAGALAVPTSAERVPSSVTCRHCRSVMQLWRLLWHLNNFRTVW